jgi:acetyltransferase-like isoleucine patch superfamily enzyme
MSDIDQAAADGRTAAASPAATASGQSVRKRVRHRSRGFPRGRLLLVDALTLVVLLSPGLAGWAAFVSYVRHVWPSPHFVLWMLAAPLILAGTFLAATRLVRAVIPAVEAGEYEIGTNRRFLGWYLNMYLGHAVRVAGLQPFFFASHITKYLYWRAMGARVAFGVNSSIFATLADYPLLTIGKECTLGANCFISGHIFAGNKVLLGRVEIGDNVLVGMGTFVGPYTTIGAGSWIGMYNRLLRDQVSDNTRIDNFEWGRFNPARSAPPAPRVAAEDEA